jgi:hypothetical protein
MPLSRSLLFLAAALALLAAPAGAVVVYDTYAAGQGTPARLVGEPLDIVRNLQYADPFVVSGTFLQLESITIGLRHGAGATGDFRIFFRADDAGEPGAVLEEWVVTDQFDDDTDVELPSLEHPALSDGATYWINVKIVDGLNRGSWLVSTLESDDWLFHTGGALNPPWQSPPDAQPLGLLTVEAPEPGQALLLGTGAALLAARLRRRARTAASAPGAALVAPRGARP